MISPSLSNHTISLSVSKETPFDEGYGGTELYPGMMVRQGPDAFYYVPVADWYTVPLFVLENPYEGKTFSDPYDEDANVMLRYGRSGDIFLSKISGTWNPTISYGMPLMTDGGGWFKEWGEIVGEKMPLAVSREEDLSPVFPRWTAIQII